MSAEVARSAAVAPDPQSPDPQQIDPKRIDQKQIDPQRRGMRGGAAGLETAALVALAVLAFAGNSLLCRLALRRTGIDFASFTSIRLLAGALVLAAVWRLPRPGSAAPARVTRLPGSHASALALFVYAAAFSLAYVHLSAATGALLLFGTVQATMIGTGLARGERLRGVQLVGLACALGGLLALLLPGLTAPPPASAALMALAGVAWGVYTLRGRGPDEALAATAGNFIRALPLAALLTASTWSQAAPDARGLLYAAASGGITSGLGYAVWYSVLPRLDATRAGVVQLGVPAIAAVGGVALLDEPLSARLAVSSLAILGGVLIVILAKAKKRAPA